MAVGVILTVPGGSQQQNDQIAAAVLSDGTLPEGWVVHVVGPAEGGWCVINVVPSQEEFEAFAREKLIPTAQQVDGHAPQITFFPIHRLIRG
jgi:hypothetical protein